MANEADKKRAKRLVDKADKQFVKAKSQQEYRQWAKTYLPLLEQAISLNPDNDAAWNLCGVVKSQLGDHEGGIEYFTKALEINPENDATRQNLEATEIAFASHQNAKKPQQEKEEYHEHLRKRARNHKLIFYFLIMLRWLLFICIITIIFAFIVLFAILFLLYVYGGSDSPLRQAIGELNFFTLWPYFMLMFICLMPFFVMLRLNIQDAKRELILEEDFEGRYIVELYLERFFSAEHDRRNFAEKYISYWMHNNPSETLLRLDKKSSDQSDAAHIDIMRELIRSQNTPS